MNAKQAKELSYKTNTDARNSQLAKCYEAIKSAAEKGDYEATVNVYLKKDTQELLISQGYSVHQRERDYSIITWK